MRAFLSAEEHRCLLEDIGGIFPSYSRLTTVDHNGRLETHGDVDARERAIPKARKLQDSGRYRHVYLAHNHGEEIRLYEYAGAVVAVQIAENAEWSPFAAGMRTRPSALAEFGRREAQLRLPGLTERQVA